MPTLSGIVKDEFAQPCAALVRAYRRSDGKFIGETISNAATGAYSITTLDTSPHVVVRLNASATAGDPLRQYAALHLHFDGANNSTTFTDVCRNTVTANGNAKISTAARVRVNNLNITSNGAAVYVNGVVSPLDAEISESPSATDVPAAVVVSSSSLIESAAGSEYAISILRRNAALAETAIAESVQQALGSPSSDVSVSEFCPATDHAISFADWHAACAEQSVVSAVSSSWALFETTISEASNACDSVFLRSGLLGEIDADAFLFVWSATPTIRVLSSIEGVAVIDRKEGICVHRRTGAVRVAR